MTKSPDERRNKAQPDTEWLQGVEAALIRARQRALEEAQRTGVPIVSVVDGKLVEFYGPEDKEGTPLADS